MGAAHSYFSSCWRGNRVEVLQPAEPLKVDSTSARKSEREPSPSSAAARSTAHVSTPATEPTPSNEVARAASSESCVIRWSLLPGAVVEPMPDPVIRNQQEPEPQLSNSPLMDSGHLVVGEINTDAPLPPLSSAPGTGKRSLLRRLALSRRNLKLQKQPPLPPIDKSLFAAPDPVLQDIDEEDVKFGTYQSCKQAHSGKAVSFELVFDDETNGTKPAIQQRPKSSRRKLKKHITKKLKAANERKTVSEQHVHTCMHAILMTPLITPLII